MCAGDILSLYMDSPIRDVMDIVLWNVARQAARYPWDSIVEKVTELCMF